MEGFVEIEAENHVAALSAAEQLYNGSGAELPEMEDSTPLRFSIAQPAFELQEPKKIEGKPSVEDVRNYLIKQGYPEPSEALMNEFLNGGDDQAMYDEAVRENYCMADVDRWFHLKDLFKQHISFGTAMLIDDALWNEEYESMEINSAKDILDTPEQICKKRIEMLIAVFNKDGTVVPNEYDVTDADIAILGNAFEIPLNIPQEHKAPLSSLIESADLRSSENNISAENPAKAQDPIR